MESFPVRQPVEILIVDDEPQAVKYFRKAFGSKYDVLTATSADEAEALVLSGNHNIGLVITDQRMPGRSGVSLLNTIRNERPEIIRILTTAYSDLDSAIEAVNKGEILRYLTKPWDLRVLEAEIDQAITFYLLKNEYDLLLREKLGALHRTLLRDRVNCLAVIAGSLPYKSAAITIYRYLKETLAEMAWRPAVQKQWSELPVQDHWRIPVEETQRNIDLVEALMDKSLLESSSAETQSDVATVISRCSEEIGRDHGIKHIRLGGGEAVVVPVQPDVLSSIVYRLLEPISRWTVAGSTVDVSIGNESNDDDERVAKIRIETRNCDPAKALQDCVLFTPALQGVPRRASEYLKAILAVGHLGGTISSPPMENGYKQVEILLPLERNSDTKGSVAPPPQWLQDLNDEYERWVLGTLDGVC